MSSSLGSITTLNMTVELLAGRTMITMKLDFEFVRQAKSRTLLQNYSPIDIKTSGLRSLGRANDGD